VLRSRVFKLEDIIRCPHRTYIQFKTYKHWCGRTIFIFYRLATASTWKYMYDSHLFLFNPVAAHTLKNK